MCNKYIDLLLLIMSTFPLISEYCTRHFEALQKESPYLMSTIKKIPKSMRDRERVLEDDDEYTCWKPIPSTFTDKDLKKLESFLGHPLPEAYRFFLRQWHFIELYMDQASLLFFPSVPHELVSIFKGILKKMYKGLTKRGFLPFANYSDWGVACFDARQPVPGNDYPIVILDHEDGYAAPMSYTTSFLEMFKKEKDALIWLGVPGWQPDPNKKV